MAIRASKGNNAVMQKKLTLLPQDDITQVPWTRKEAALIYAIASVLAKHVGRDAFEVFYEMEGYQLSAYWSEEFQGYPKE